MKWRSIKHRRRTAWVLALALLSVLSLGISEVRALPAGLDATPKEKNLGSDASKSVEEFYGVLERPEWNLRILSAAAPLQRVITRHDIQFTFKVLDSPEINAMALPGGYVYVTRGLMDFLNNDRELQGVLAHEMAHVDLGHGLGIYKRQMRSMITTILAILASRDPDVVQAVNATNEALYQGYGRRAEDDADIKGLDYLIAAKQPLDGFFTFMDRLQVQENHRPNFSKDYFFTHAPTDDRLKAAENYLKTKNLPIPARKYQPRITLYAKGGALPDGQIVGMIASKDYNRWLTLGPDQDEGVSGFERAERASKLLNILIKDGLRSYELRSQCLETGCSLKYQDSIILRVTPKDQELYGLSPKEVVEAWKNTLRKVLWQDFVENRV